MSEEAHWSAGDVIVFRGLGPRGIWTALPVFVVQDTAELMAVYWPAGTRGKWRMKPSGEKVTPRDIVFTPMEIIDHTWNKTDVLMLIPCGAAHSVYLMRDALNKNLLCWYVNLQDPLQRTPIGFDTGDHLLDIVFTPDKSGWQWKDEDHLAEAVALGIFSKEQACAIRQEGERVIALIRENQAPFNDGWENWLPPADWGVPTLPAGWDLGYETRP